MKSGFLPAFFAAALPVLAMAPQGRLLEVHAHDLYAGGCTASAQASLGGRSLLRVWQFERGDLAGTDLAGLTVAALQVADGNLAHEETPARATVLYVPTESSSAQRAALAAWFASIDPQAGEVLLEPTSLLWREGSPAVRIGDRIAVRTREIDPCGAVSCGEELWYSPRTDGATDYRVLSAAHLEADEPALQLVWRTARTPSVFYARFGESPAAVE